MKKRYWIWMAALLSVALWGGCEDEDSAETEDLDSYFESHPYVSDPRSSPEARIVTIYPEQASLNHEGQQIVFTANGGKGPYTWDVSVPAKGYVVATRETTQGVFVGTVVGDNNVIVYDKEGHAAVANITGSAAELDATVSPATINADGDQAVCAATGGVQPYTWSVSNGTRGSIDNTTGPSVTYTRLTSGNNVVKVTDAVGDVVNLLINQP